MPDENRYTGRLYFRAEKGDEEGLVRATVSEVDKVGRDGIMLRRGCFGEETHNIFMSAWMHNSTPMVATPVNPVGGGTAWEEDGYIRAQIRMWMEDVEAQRAWRNLDELPWLEWSLSFWSVEAPLFQWSESIGNMLTIFERVNAYEASPVHRGGSFGTKTEELRIAARADYLSAQTNRAAQDKELLAQLQAREDWALADQLQARDEWARKNPV